VKKEEHLIRESPRSFSLLSLLHNAKRGEGFERYGVEFEANRKKKRTMTVIRQRRI